MKLSGKTFINDLQNETHYEAGEISLPYFYIFSTNIIYKKKCRYLYSCKIKIPNFIHYFEWQKMMKIDEAYIQ